MENYMNFGEVLQTNAFTTKSDNGFILFFLRAK